MKKALLYEELNGRRARCKVCQKGCRISEGETGWCKTRKNAEGKLFSTTYG